MQKNSFNIKLLNHAVSLDDNDDYYVFLEAIVELPGRLERHKGSIEYQDIEIHYTVALACPWSPKRGKEKKLKAPVQNPKTRVVIYFTRGKEPIHPSEDINILKKILKSC